MKRLLLLVDAMLGFVIGAFLVAWPDALVLRLDLPQVATRLYVTVLGALVLGGSFAVVMELRGWHGLSLRAAAMINALTGAAIAGWLLANPGGVGTGGGAVLWGLTGVLFALGVLEGRLVLRGEDPAGDESR